MKISLGKIIGMALLAGLIPYRVKTDKESGEVEVGALLWGVKKTPMEGKDNYTVEMLPFMKSGEEAAEE